MRPLLVFILSFLFLTAQSFADQPKRYASIVVDADSLEIIHARQIDGQRFPASLTKVMTLFLTFDALNAGTLKIDEKLTVSANAARTEPVKLGLRKGQTLSVNDAIQSLTVRSSNDVAVVLAERLGGTEANFTEMMNSKARELGMIKTVFKTPHGLPHPEQTTTARDMAKLASSILRHHRRYYHYFGQENFTWNGRTRKNTNSLLHWLAGVDGFKTGYTRDSGYNLIISAERDGRRLIAVVLGGASGKSRDKHMQDLVERGFDALGVTPVTSKPPVIVAKAPVTKPVKTQSASVTEAVRLRGRNNRPLTVMSQPSEIKIAERSKDRAWSIQVGIFSNERAAREQLSALAQMPDYGLAPQTAQVLPLNRGDRTLHRARFSGLSAVQASAACKRLENLAGGCLVIAPG